jgi:hypothetical protein
MVVVEMVVVCWGRAAAAKERATAATERAAALKVEAVMLEVTMVAPAAGVAVAKATAVVGEYSRGRMHLGPSWIGLRWGSWLSQKRSRMDSHH